MPPEPVPGPAGEDADRGAPGRDSHAGPGDSGPRVTPAGIGEQFADGMPLDAASTGPALAKALAVTSAGLAGLSDDALAGFLGGCRKTASWTAAMLLDGIAEYAGRRPDDATPGRAFAYAAAARTAHAARAAGEPADPPPYDEFAADELMPVLRLSRRAAEAQVELALALRYRLHATMAALLAGRIDLMRARIIAEGTADLSPADAAAVEALVLGLAGQQTYVALGIALGKAVLKVDPAGAARRRRRGEKRARVERWREYDGTGALAGRNLPPGDTLAADQALTALALDLREAGLDGPLDYLRATALIDQITGRDSRPAPASPETPGQDATSTSTDGAGQDSEGQDSASRDGDEDEDWDDRGDWPGLDQWVLDHTQHDMPGPGSDTEPASQSEPDGKDGTRDGSGTHLPQRPGRPGGRGKKRRGNGNRIAARINLTIPLTTHLELGTAPGDAGPFGPLDPAATRDITRAAAAHPGTRWCLTVTDEQGHAVAHGCARGPRTWAGQAPRDGPGNRDGPQGSSPSPDELITRFLARLGITVSPIARKGCDHRDAEPRYTPSRKLRHKIHARTPTCSYWGCRRPAERCDDDHTTAWDNGGMTCECNLSPLCRRHHRMKQREGWTLTQPRPGTMVWKTPGGRRYTTTPARYTV